MYDDNIESEAESVKNQRVVFSFESYVFNVV